MITFTGLLNTVNALVAQLVERGLGKAEVGGSIPPSGTKTSFDMIACVCRNIKESDYDTPEKLKERIMKDDAVCCACQRYYINKDGERHGVPRIG